ncbi:uncharacterized protein (DUF2236 family) [Okibacterium sp. HSC-33S16]|uniref:oxygenase MpaB family protein n=1 Tax=Okibacterium sp. HSC-33S16 TaxID=2910965 RepID=UPI00209CA68F|nr:oxygenase MpaB family protein [Okibacterium sp. HSC-33S16]MCP2030087.1 uncharacterized protein (DUF2236 family) [Okibacterium sp. HSC-33S16]
MSTLSEVGRDALLVAGGGRAILLQIANPSVGRGVAAHSNFATRPLDRLHSTLTFVYAQAFGTDSDKRVVRRRVNRAHAPVSADATTDTPGYSAFDPDLQLWVAATLYDTAITLRELVYGPLDPAAADEIYREYAVLGTALQMPAALWPATRSDFDSYFAAESDRLEVTPEALAVSTSLLAGRVLPAPLRAAMPLVRLVTAGLLSPRLREAYGFHWTPRQQRRFDRVIAMTRVVWPRLPRSIRFSLSSFYLRRLRTGADVDVD